MAHWIKIGNSEICVNDEIVSLWSVGSGEGTLNKIMDCAILASGNYLSNERYTVMLSGFAE